MAGPGHGGPRDSDVAAAVGPSRGPRLTTCIKCVIGGSGHRHTAGTAKHTHHRDTPSLPARKPVCPRSSPRSRYRLPASGDFRLPASGFRLQTATSAAGARPTCRSAAPDLAGQLMTVAWGPPICDTVCSPTVPLTSVGGKTPALILLPTLATPLASAPRGSHSLVLMSRWTASGSGEQTLENRIARARGCATGSRWSRRRRAGPPRRRGRPWATNSFGTAARACPQDPP